MRSIIRRHGAFGGLALLLAAVAVYYFNGQPFFMDAFYHYNAAGRIAAGAGFVDDYLWTYIGARGDLPAPSHLYWMPGTSLIAAAGMALFGHSYAAAQVGLWLLLWGAALTAYALGLRLGGTPRHAWAAGLMVLCGGYFLRYWGATDTFAPYACVGALALLAMGHAADHRTRRPGRWWLLAGVLAAAGHLIRSDGLLLLLTGAALLLWRSRRPLDRWPAWRHLALFSAAYGLTMSPWFARNLAAVGTLLPVGGTQAIWYTTYDDLFNYPAAAGPATFFAQGAGLLLESRWEAFFGSNGALLTFIAVEGFIILPPFILLALWRRRHEAFLQPLLLFAVGLHLAFPLLFPFPGMRGGLFHAAAALLPWWAALGIVGIDDAVNWMAQRRRQWRGVTGKRVFTTATVGLVALLSLTIAGGQRVQPYTLAHYESLRALPPAARLMVNDPPQLYYYTGRGGVVLPNAAPAVIPLIAAEYDIDYLLVELTPDGVIAVPPPLLFDLDAPPPFLQELPACACTPSSRPADAQGYGQGVPAAAPGT
ncbi:MAG: glycosyltransferase family 39 protein [Anaerolineae bacterium]|nr:glycosyltransferase family 39 protein [Anaerolineae bacterium]